MTKFFVFYAGRRVNFEVPSDWRVRAIGNTPELQPKEDPGDTVLKALENTLETRPLRQIARGKKKAVVVCEDHKRASPAQILVPPVLDVLNKSDIPDESITVIVGSGTHEPPNDAQLAEKLGKEVLGRVRVELHNPRANNLVKAGSTHAGTEVWLNRTFWEADVKVGVGAVKPHHIAGFTGGPKIVLPGVAGWESIAMHHFRYIQEPTCRILQLDGNPAWEDMLDAARLGRLDVKVDCVTDINSKVVAVFAGEAAAAQRKAAEFFSATYKVVIPQPLDVVIASGYPTEINLAQAQASALYTSTYGPVRVLKDGGTVILSAQLKEGLTPHVQKALTQNLTIEQIIAMADRGDMPIEGAPSAARLTKLLKATPPKLDYIVVADKKWRQDLEDCGIRYAGSIEEAVDDAHQKHRAADVGIFPLSYYAPALPTDSSTS